MPFSHLRQGLKTDSSLQFYEYEKNTRFQFSKCSKHDSNILIFIEVIFVKHLRSSKYLKHIHTFKERASFGQSYIRAISVNNNSR